MDDSRVVMVAGPVDDSQLMKQILKNQIAIMEALSSNKGTEHFAENISRSRMLCSSITKRR